LALPVFGLVSHILGIEGTQHIFNKLGMYYAAGAICVVGFFVWAHHMFCTGVDIDARTYFTCCTYVIALPTAIKVFTWVVAVLRLLVGSTGLKIIMAFIACFLCGGVTGLILANGEIDNVVHDSYFVVGHFHYILSLAAFFGVLVAALWCYKTFFALQEPHVLARVSVSLLFIATNAIF
jgi:cytochrome c oxidase subunit 1